MRAVHVRQNLEGVCDLGEDVDARVRAGLGEAQVAEIETAPRSKWLPIEVDVELSRLVHAHAGHQAFVDWSRAAMVASAETPLLSGFVRAGLRLFGGNPGSLIRLARRGYEQIFRDAGALSVEPRREDSVRVVGVDLPAQIVDEPLYLEGIGESIAALPLLVGFEGFSQLCVRGTDVAWTITWRSGTG